MTTSDRRRSEAGFSVIEVTVVLAVLSAVAMSMTISLLNSQRSFDEQFRESTLRDASRRVMDRVSELLPGADPATVTPAVLENSTSISFQPVTGFDGTKYLHGPRVTFLHQLAEGEARNGRDDNGDGRIDEGSLVLQEQGRNAIILAADVTGVQFSATETGVEFRIDMAQIAGSGTVLDKTYARRVAYRNAPVP